VSCGSAGIQRTGAVNEFPGIRRAVAAGIVAATGSAGGEAVERLPVDCQAIDVSVGEGKIGAGGGQRGSPCQDAVTWRGGAGALERVTAAVRPGAPWIIVIVGEGPNDICALRERQVLAAVVEFYFGELI